jgi:hypothetical protein
MFISIPQHSFKYHAQRAVFHKKIHYDIPFTELEIQLLDTFVYKKENNYVHNVVSHGHLFS